MSQPGGDRPLRPLREGLAAASVIATYYLIPVRTERDLGVRVLFTAITLAILGVIITRHVRRGNDPIGRLFLILLVTIACLALAFYIAAGTPGQFEGLETRTDALYFTVVTLATIGYGDIHPNGQLARILVMLAVVFQAVFLTTLASTIAGRLRSTQAPDQ